MRKNSYPGSEAAVHPHIANYLADVEQQAAKTSAANKAAAEACGSVPKSRAAGISRVFGLGLAIAPYSYFEYKLQSMAVDGINRAHGNLLSQGSWGIENSDDDNELRRWFPGRYRGR
jgi:hypothetical protein